MPRRSYPDRKSPSPHQRRPVQPKDSVELRAMVEAAQAGYHARSPIATLLGEPIPGRSALDKSKETDK